jgi:hypothetical protein
VAQRLVGCVRQLLLQQEAQAGLLVAAAHQRNWAKDWGELYELRVRSPAQPSPA